jgi:argininosuccinate lyase
MIVLLLKGVRARGYIVALVTLHKDLPVSNNRDIQYSCEGYMALALVVQETFSSLLVVTLNDVRMT